MGCNASAPCPPSGVATAANKVVLGGGAGIVVDGTYCTLTTIGHDKTGEVVGFTAASCGGHGAQVVAEGAENHGAVGTADDGLAYSVIKFDPAKVNPIHDFDGFAIDGIGPDPGPGQPACTQGGATGYGCGSMEVRLKPAIAMARVPSWQPGDDGAPVTVDGQLIGMTRKGYTMAPIVLTDITVMLFSAILNDVNAKGGPGACSHRFLPESPDNREGERGCQTQACGIKHPAHIRCRQVLQPRRRRPTDHRPHVSIVLS